ncbi:hypothetical protein vseg_005161 [Gypsophila vaccaria]
MGESNEHRLVLGDVTNQVRNQGFPFVTRGLRPKPLTGNKRAAQNADDDLRSSKQICVAKCTSKVTPNKVGLSPLRGGKIYRLKTGSGDAGSVDGRVGLDAKEPSCSADDSVHLGEGQHVASVVNVNNGSNEEGTVSISCENKYAADGNVCRGEETRGICHVRESDFNPVEVATQALSDNGKTCSWSDSVETSRFALLQETRSFALERCTLVKGEGSNSLPGGMDLLKNCSCSFCTKAAYIWSDLQCQDIKGRISTLAKSQKEASNLVQKYSKEMSTSEAQGNLITAPPLETDLKTLWKSLFLHMDTVYAAESSQLQSNFAMLKDVREDYKMNLEMINVKPPDTQQCSSDDLIN